MLHRDTLLEALEKFFRESGGTFNKIKLDSCYDYSYEGFFDLEELRDLLMDIYGENS